MDHSYIDERNLVDGYLMGTLPSEELDAFEEHLVDCARCLDRLEEARIWRDALKRSVAEGPRAHGITGWLSRGGKIRQGLLLLAASLAIVATPAALWRALNRARAELQDARSVSAQWRGRYEQEFAARSQAPRVPSSLPIFALALVRGSAAPAPQRIHLPPAAPWIILSVDVASDSGLARYQASLSDAQSQVVWTADDVDASPAGELALMVPTAVLTPGARVLEIHGLKDGGQPVPIGRYSFTVEK